MNKLTWQEFKKIMQDASKEGKQITGVIVFKPESFDKEYSEQSRSYEVSSGDKYWNPNMGGTSLFGYCLDGTDQGARLDWYMKATPKDNLGKRWLVDYCYLKDDNIKKAEELVKVLRNPENPDERVEINKLPNGKYQTLYYSDEKSFSGAQSRFDSLDSAISQAQKLRPTYKVKEAENKVKKAFRDGYKDKVKVIKNESLVGDVAARINQNDRYEGKEMQTEDGMLASRIALVAENLGDDYSEWLGDQEVKEIIEDIKTSDEWKDFNDTLDRLIQLYVEDKVDYIRKDEPASRYYTGEESDESKDFIKNKKTGEILTKSDVKERWKDQKEYFANNAGVDIKDYEYPFEKYLADIDETGDWEFINGEKVEEDYTQASNAGAIKVDIMGQPKKKNKKDKEDKALKSLPVQQVLIEGKDGEYREIEEKIEKEMYEYLEDNGIDLSDENLEFNEALKSKIADLLVEFHTDIISEYMARYDENLMFDCDVTDDRKINVNVWSF